MSCPHQALYFQSLHESNQSIWQTLPEMLKAQGVQTPTGRDYTIQIVNHWKAVRESRPIPEECIPVVAAAYASENDDEGKALEIEAAIRREMKRDHHHGDFWINADNQLKGFKILKPIMPPFTSPRRRKGQNLSTHEKPFLDFCIDRFLGFSGHRISVDEETDVAKILEDIVAQRHTIKIGFGLLSSIERLVLLEPLHLPIRIGLNAVCIVRDDNDRPRVNQIREILLGYPQNGENNTLAMAAKHDVGWTHLKQLIEEGVISKAHAVPSVPTTSASEYVQRLTRGSDPKVMRYAIANEVTCLSILKELKHQNIKGQLVFDLATSGSIEKRKPEYLMSILIKRGEDPRTAAFLKDTLWMLLQADVELLATEYAALCKTLKEFAEEAGETRAAKEWAEYTLRLGDNYLRRYVDQHLPWQPILHRALEIYLPK